MDVRDTSTILAALRNWQNIGRPSQIEALMDIATNCGEFEPLNDPEIDSLCEEINDKEFLSKVG